MNQEVLNKKVYTEQVKMLYASMSSAVLANIVTSILFITIQWQVIETPTLLSWFFISVTIIALRTALLLYYKNESHRSDKIEKLGLYFLIGSSASGLALGSAGIFLFPQNEPIYQLACAFVLLGMASGAVASLSFGKFNFLIYASMTLLPLIISLAIEGTRLTLILIPMILLSFIFLLKSSQTIYKNTEQNIHLRLQASEREKELLKSQQRHILHTQNTPLGVIEWDTNFRVKEWNTSAEKIFGYTKNEALNKKAEELIIAEDDKEQVSKIWHQLLNNEGGTHSENKNITKNGDTITAEWFNTTLINDNGITIGVTSLVQDITERKRVEKMKSEFVATVSHELRTPLTAIKGSLGLVLGGATGKITDETTTMLTTANKNTDRLLMLINDILDMKKIESGNLDFIIEPYDIMQLIEEAIDANKTYAEQYQIHFIITERADNKKILVDRFRFTQVMSNLLSNAVKFSNKNENVEISATTDNINVRISVIDHGKGISEDFKNKIFSRFSQSDSTNTRNTGGTGLGLAITKLITEKFGGTIGFNSEEGKGSEFYIDLPLAP